MARWRFLALFFFVQQFLLSGCGLIAASMDKGGAAADAGAAGVDESSIKGTPIPYRVIFKVDGEGAGLEGKMRSLSQLVELEKDSPDSVLAIERRARSDVETALKLLHSQCYYDGNASYTINEDAKPVEVVFTITPGARYNVGRADIHYDPRPDIPAFFRERTIRTGFFNDTVEKLASAQFPKSIPGVESGKPIVADAMLNAVGTLPEELKRNGYPLARVVESIYTLDRQSKTLNADIVVDPGPPAMMGGIHVTGNSEVSSEYIERLVPWKPACVPWDSALLENYANMLRGLGLFRSVEAMPFAKDKSETIKDGQVIEVMPIEVSVVDAPMRSLGAAVRYDTDSGFGVNGTWEHRNLFHSGEKLTVDVPISLEESGIKAAFEKPAFLIRQQRFLANAAFLNQNTDAYQQTSLRADIGIDRRFARQWTGGISVYAEGGSLKDNDNSESSYGVFSPRGNLKYDSRNNKLNPSTGMETQLQIRPFGGFYKESFSAFAGTLSANFYYSPLPYKNGKPDDSLVIAARLEGGGMVGSPLDSIPSSLRYYAGGAGSVRGYPYQAIGPRDSENDPSGGRSYQIVNLEARFRFADNFGVVPFIDGGMVYKDEFPRIIGDMDWGAGLGFRYYTPIGPVRLDLATPLNYIKDDPPIQVYVSIGQSF